jgi:hypothetical protein
MTTALQLINDAADEIGVSESGQTLPSEDAQRMLRKLNQRLEVWSNTRLMLPTLTEISVPLDGSASYTIGPTGDVEAARPIRVESATAVDSAGLEWGVEVLNRDQWNAIGFKNVDGGPPACIWYDAQNTNGRVYVYPRSTSYTLKLDCLTVLASFSLSTECTLPPGYEAAIVLTLAEDCAGLFGKPISPDLRMRAMGARNAIKRVNTEPLLLDVWPAAQPYQIERGY